VVGFDEGAEAIEGGVPLAGQGVEIVFEGLDREGVEFVEALAAGVGAADDAGALEDAEVLGDGLAGERGAFGELRDGALLASAARGGSRLRGRRRVGRGCDGADWDVVGWDAVD